MNEERTNQFDNFNWDSEISEVDFFGEVEEVAPVKEKKEETVEEVNIKEAETQEEEDLFEDFKEEEKVLKEVEDEETKETNSKLSSNDIRNSLQYLIQQGVVEEEELPEDVDEDYLVDTINKTVERRFEESIQSLPEEVKNIIKYVHNGGKLKDIIDTYSETFEIDENIDMSDTKNQEKVLKYLMMEDGEEDEELIDANIEFLKESGKLASISQKKFDKWKEEREEYTRRQIEEQQKQKQLARENQIKFKRDLNEILSKNNEIKGLNISAKEAKDLPSYISDNSIKLQDGRTISPFYKDLFEALKDQEKIIALAKILKNDFDFSDLKKGIVTKSTREIKKDIERQEKKSPQERSSQNKKRLIDYL